MRAALASVVLAGLVSVACGDEAPTQNPFADRHTSWRRVRVVTSDSQVGRLTIFDAEDEEVIGRIELPAPVRLDATHAGDHGLLLGPSGVGFLASGVAIIDHTDHIHIYKSQPKLRAFTLGSGSAPVAAGSHAGWIGALFIEPGLRAALFMREHTLRDASVPAPERWDADLQAALPFGEGGLGVRGGELVLRENKTLPERTLGPCAQPAASVVAGGLAAFSCEHGVAVVERTPDASPAADPRVSFVTAGPSGRPTRLRFHPTGGALVGDLSARAFLTIQRSETGAWEARETRPPLPADVCGFELEPRDGKTVVGLTTDGHLRSWAIDGTGLKTGARLVDPFVCERGLSRPHLALAPERGYITDPRTGSLHEIDLRSLRRARSHAVGGRPGPVTVLGVDLANANVAPGAEHGPEGDASAALGTSP